MTLTCRFQENQLSLDWQEQASFTEGAIPRLVGSAEPTVPDTD